MADTAKISVRSTVQQWTVCQLGEPIAGNGARGCDVSLSGFGCGLGVLTVAGFACGLRCGAACGLVPLGCLTGFRGLAGAFLGLPIAAAGLGLLFDGACLGLPVVG